MRRSTYCVTALGFVLLSFIAWTVFAQQAPAEAQAPKVPLRGATNAPRPPVFFHESWKPVPAETPITQEFVSSPNLELKLYGPGAGGKDSQHTLDINTRPAPDNVSFIWSGMTEDNWALTLRDKNNYVDLRGSLTKICWRSMQSGFHLLRPVIKTADGKYYVGDKTDGLTVDWHENEIAVADVRWLALNPKTAYELPWGGEGLGFQTPDLSRVDEVGFTDLARGSGHGAGGNSRVNWIEVIGYPVPRSASATNR
jgi:hypothetical protein